MLLVGTAMVKQALGLPSANYRLRPDTRLHVLHYPQQSMTQTRAMKATKFLGALVVRTRLTAVLSHHDTTYAGRCNYEQS